MPAPAELSVSVAWDGSCVRRVELRASDSIPAAALCAGRSAREVAALLERLYSVCAEAQGAAARAALAAAAGTEADEPMPGCAVRLEIVHEHLWRLLVDWPQLAGEQPRYAAFLPVRTALVAAFRADATRCTAALAQAAAMAAREIYGMPPARWAEIADLAALGEWAERAATLPARLLAGLWREQPRLGCSQVALMPADDEALRAALPGILIAPSPRWQHEPAETGALARLRAQPLLVALCAAVGESVVARITARLLELARLLAVEPLDGGCAWPAQGIRIDRGVGVGAVQTARGLLLHQARLDGGTVRDYRIVSPTDWNFAPDGPLVSGLLGTVADAASELEERARLAVLALDPCVACRVEVCDA